MLEPDVTIENKPVETETIEAWGEFLDALNPYLKITGEICVKNIAKMVMLKISQYVNEENMFTMNDEKIFGHYAGIMANYAETARIYNESLSDMNDLRLREILNGISEILSAQLKQYEEHMGGEASEWIAKNPISAEKELIMRSVYDNVLSALRTVLDNIFSDSGYFERNELREYCFDCAYKSANESHVDFFTFVYQRVIVRGGLDIYKSYSGAIMQCKNRINSLDLRKETQYFYEALKQENENLNSIVKIQVAALTEELEKGCGDAERQTIERIIASLKEMRELAEEEATELSKIFGEAESSVKMPVLMNYDGFLSYIEEIGLCEGADKLREEGLETGTLSSVQHWKEKLDIFVRKYDDFVKAHTEPPSDELKYKRFLYETRLKITDKLILADEMLKGFRELAEFYSENEVRLKESAPEDYMKIIEGIHESVAIKIDVLEEGRKTFSDDADKLLSSSVPPEKTEGDLKMLFRLRLNVWRDEMLGIGEAYGKDYLDAAANNIPLIIQKINEINETEEYGEKLEKKIDREAGVAAKLEMSYLRDCVLFEIITFEEILAYSVSKLRESSNDAVLEYAEKCGALEETLIKLCKFHNILIIAPQPYDTFNSSEHEVLVAEKNDDYKKGQIIKMMNSGFKYNEAVLVRANVIAAK